MKPCSYPMVVQNVNEYGHLFALLRPRGRVTSESQTEPFIGSMFYELNITLQHNTGLYQLPVQRKTAKI